MKNKTMLIVAGSLLSFLVLLVGVDQYQKTRHQEVAPFEFRWPQKTEYIEMDMLFDDKLVSAVMSRSSGRIIIKHVYETETDFVMFGQQDRNYVVKDGDTLDGIANSNSLTVGELMYANDLTEPTIKVGQELYIPIVYE